MVRFCFYLRAEVALRRVFVERGISARDTPIRLGPPHVWFAAHLLGEARTTTRSAARRTVKAVDVENAGRITAAPSASTESIPRFQTRDVVSDLLYKPVDLEQVERLLLAAM
jgi:hypothetical protein